MKKPKQILKYRDYQKRIESELENYKKTIEELENLYYDFDEIRHLCRLEPLNYIDYCKILNFEPEKDIKQYVEEKDKLKITK
ncbi:MAG: hypothetical protein GY739_18805 [Mesoflavibacter sp.]|nr:hypothetical protein [Mesoflavibacter sp.]